MTSIPTAHTFLESVSGYSQLIGKAEIPSANTPIRLAVIDPSYTVQSYPTTLPKVTFEGEETLSEKRYPTINGYVPYPNDRVVMLPVGHTYAIVGAIDSFPARGYAVDGDTVLAEEISSNTSYGNLGTTGPTVSNIPLAPGQKAKITISCGLFLDTSPAGARARMSWAVSGAETIAAHDDWSIFVSLALDYVYGARPRVFTATTGGLYTFQAKYKVAGSVTGTWAGRELTVERSYG